jgi:hypothetical protein
MFTRLLDRWWDHHIARSRRPRRLPADISIDVGSYPYCACGHVANVHRHYRDGNDCSPCECRSYTSFRRTTP